VAVLGWGQGGTGPQIFGWFRSALFLLEGFWGPEICLECVGGRGFAPDPSGGAHDAPPDPLVGWGGGGGRHPLPRTPRLSAPRSSRFQRSALAARRHVSNVHPPKFWQYSTNCFYSNFASQMMRGQAPKNIFFLEPPLLYTVSVIHGSPRVRRVS